MTTERETGGVSTEATPLPATGPVYVDDDGTVYAPDLDLQARLPRDLARAFVAANEWAHLERRRLTRLVAALTTERDTLHHEAHLPPELLPGPPTQRPAPPHKGPPTYTKGPGTQTDPLVPVAVADGKWAGVPGDDLDAGYHTYHPDCCPTCCPTCTP